MSILHENVLDKGFVRSVQYWGSDLTIPQAARVSFAEFDEEMTEERITGMIRFMMKNKHGSVFEHCGLTVHVKGPLFVFREWHRHRAGHSYNEWSGRYSVLEPEWYTPDFIRHQVGKPGAYTFEPVEDEQLRKEVQERIDFAALNSFNVYQSMLDSGIAKEQARLVLPVNMYSQMWATSNLRGWMNFLELRNTEHAMFEIREFAKAVEFILTMLFPITMNQFIENGRVAP